MPESFSPLLPWIRDMQFFRIFQSVTIGMSMLTGLYFLLVGLMEYHEVYTGKTGNHYYSPGARVHKLTEISRKTILKIAGTIILAVVGIGNALAIALVVLTIAAIIGVTWVSWKIVKAMVIIAPNFFRSAMGKSV